MSELVFCYKGKKGEEFRFKCDCECKMNPNNEKCTASKEAQKFLTMSHQAELEGLSSEELIKQIESVYDWDKTEWIQFHVNRKDD